MKLNAFLKGNEEIPEAYTIQFMITELYNLCTLCIQHQSSHICLTRFLKEAYFRSTFNIFY